MIGMPDLAEGYYVESAEGLLFAVKGLIHPPGAVVAYLRYVPDPGGKRERRGIRYRRLYHFGEQEELLREKCPDCLFFDPVFGGTLQGVPRERIKQVYDPCLRLAELRQGKSLDGLEEKAVEFANLLAEKAGVSEECIGISGSILVNLHTSGSDIDLVVYGVENCRAVHGALRELMGEPDGEVRRLSGEELRALYATRSQDTPMSFEDFAWLEGRKVIPGKFRRCEYFIRFVKSPVEVEERYGDRRYISLGRAEIEATVADASEGIFTPCIYKIEDVRLVEGQRAAPLPVEIVSFRGRFCEQAEEGERVRARGKLERVISRGGEVHHRLLLGRPGDFMTLSKR
ncbi:MAG: hypothetical protein DRI61_06030 [Chloroflexi bacterium]|nr:MAG: hypothetical protein DRI61_06030 [Chloroflexota bacterium]